nr:cob(I)yrinic acid a,c-diamide adenosyltransferase [Labedaea rhizosphaerae]
MSVVINKVYTRTGDDGTTTAAAPGRVSKADPRIEALGDVDELVTAIGLAIAAPAASHVTLLRQLQNELFDLGADVAGGGDRVGEDHVLALEEHCDEHNAGLPALRSFVLPGTDPYSAALHHARAVCRRAERRLWTVPGSEPAARYLNRLSDLLFILARAATSEEPTWTPGTRGPG